MDKPTTETSSFRDPSGIVFYYDGAVYRQVNQCYQKTFDQLTGGGLYDLLARQGLLVPHKIVENIPFVTEEAYKILQPRQVPFVSYPYEWCFAQLKDAALATLRIHRIALDHGMILKDASAYNIQFFNGRATLIDTLSFEILPEGKPWIAYGQFCRHFLAPLFLMTYVDMRMNQLLRVYIDGVPIDLASRLLRGKGGLPVKQHIHWHARATAQYAQAGKEKQEPKREMTLSHFQMTAMIDSLIRTVEKLQLPGVETEWGDYYEHTNYSESSQGSKADIVKGYLNRVAPHSVWDLGANDGTYSRLALSDETHVVAFDIDPVAVQKNYCQVKAKGENMLPLLLDLTNLSPAIGFANQERGTLIERQHPDCILMLAVIHHLAISNNLPLERIARWLSEITDYVVIEFVPKGDSQVEILLRTRDDIFPSYTQEGFEHAFVGFFDIVDSSRVENSERSLYLLQSKTSKELK